MWFAIALQSCCAVVLCVVAASNVSSESWHPLPLVLIVVLMGSIAHGVLTTCTRCAQAFRCFIFSLFAADMAYFYIRCEVQLICHSGAFLYSGDLTFSSSRSRLYVHRQPHTFISCAAFFFHAVTLARISTLCGAGNEVGAATGAVLALGLTFFKVQMLSYDLCCFALHGHVTSCFPAFLLPVCLTSFFCSHRLSLCSHCQPGCSLCT